jgi:DNA modification methylase
VDAEYVEDETSGDNWRLLLGDSCERMAELPDESVDLTVCSPPFASLFTYSPSPRDLGNSATRVQFFEHFRFIIDHLLRVTKPGRNACIHVQQLTTSKATHGYIGVTDFRGEVIREFQSAGWIYYGEATVWKDPQAQSIRTKAFTLAFQTKNRDAAGVRPALADYLLIFKKPGANATPIVRQPTSGEVTNDDWIAWASPIWFDVGDGGGLGGDHLAPVWQGVRETDTLQASAAREDADEKHIAPLQLEFIRRCVRLWSDPAELVFTPFAGIGSEVFVAVELGRRGLGIELKPGYWLQSVRNLEDLESRMGQPTLFDVEGDDAGF